MLNTKLLGATSSAPSGYIEDLFSPTVYSSPVNTATTINNGINLSGNGGLVWLKSRETTVTHGLFDTVRGVNSYLVSAEGSSEYTSFPNETLQSFNSNGFTLDPESFWGGYSFLADTSHISWTFCKHENFFDIVTWTGNGSNRTIAHSLGSAPALIIVKRVNAVGNWAVYHQSLANTEYLVLNSTAGVATGATYWNSTSPTSSVFSIGTASDVNASGGNYIAYVFGTDTANIKCGSYTGNGSSQTISCGFTGGARFILIKRTDSTGNWFMWDTARGIVSGDDPYLLSNTGGREVSNTDSVDPDSSGFSVNQLASTNINVSSANYVYLSIA